MTSEDEDRPIRGHIRSREFRRVAHGLFLTIKAEHDPDAEFHRELRAWLAVLPRTARFTHLTAARLRGWQLPKLPEQLPVFAAVGLKDPRPRRPGLICSRLVREVPCQTYEDLPVEPAEEILLRAARDLGTLDLVIMVDSARRLGHVEAAAMSHLLESRRPGVRNLRAAWALSVTKSESGGESLLRMFDRALDIDVEPQVELFDEAGNLVARADLWVTGTRLLHEYDGAHHRDTSQQRTDLRRERGLSRANYERRGFTLDDLLNHPLVAMHEIDRDLARPHVVQRVEDWRELVRESLYSAVGRQRVMNRWQRAMGITDWSRIA